VHINFAGGGAEVGPGCLSEGFLDHGRTEGRHLRDEGHISCLESHLDRVGPVAVIDFMSAKTGS